MFCIIDGTRFYSESSVIYKPQHRNVPILVSAGQGISIAANRACSLLRISKFTPIWEELDKLRLHNGLIYRANFNSLSHISDRFMSCIELNAMGTRTYRYSVDEIFLDFSHLHSIKVPLDEFAMGLRKRTYRETGVATGCGIGPTLTLCKAASWAAKNLDGYAGQCWLESEEHIDAVLEAMPIDKVWNVGSSYTKHLKAEGLFTALQLKRCNAVDYQKRYSINIANVIHELNSISVLNFSTVREKKKQIWSTASYRDRLKTQESLFAEIANHCSNVMLKVRNQQSEALKLSVFVSTSRFDSCVPFYKRVDIELEEGLTDTGYALGQLRSIYPKLLPDSLHRQPIYKIGVGTTQLNDAEKKQFELFSNFDNKTPLNTTLDSLNLRFGKGAIGYASQSKSYREKDGDIEFEELENYYTDINEILTVQCI